MALLNVYENFVCVCSSRHIYVYKIGTEDCVISHCIQECDGTEIHCGTIIATAFSPSGKYFAACTDAKHLSIWNVFDNWTHRGTRLLPRRPTSLAFTRCEKDVVVADKSGDVHRFPIDADTAAELSSNKPTLLLGHVSMLLDLKLCAADKFLVTCDRDEKIRVSHFPNAYNIQSFCLGHTDYVSRLGYFEDIDLLISASGDGTIKLWNYQDSHLVESLDCSGFLLSADAPKEQSTNLTATTASEAGIRCLCCCIKKHLIAISFNSQPVIILLTLETDSTGQRRLSFQHRLMLSEVATIIDIVFVADEYLLVSQQSSDPASLFISAFAVSCVHNSLPLKLVELTINDNDNSGLLMTVQLINKHLQRSTDASVGVTSVLPILRKARIDNMKDYIEKKRRRQEHQEAE